MSRRLDPKQQSGSLHNFSPDILRQLASEHPPETALAAANQHQQLSIGWLLAVSGKRGYDNTTALFAHAFAPQIALTPPKPEPILRLRVGNRELSDEQVGGGAQLGLQRATHCRGPRPRQHGRQKHPPRSATRSKNRGRSVCKYSPAGVVHHAMHLNVCLS